MVSDVIESFECWAHRGLAMHGAALTAEVFKGKLYKKWLAKSQSNPGELTPELSAVPDGWLSAFTNSNMPTSENAWVNSSKNK